MALLPLAFAFEVVGTERLCQGDWQDLAIAALLGAFARLLATIVPSGMCISGVEAKGVGTGDTEGVPGTEVWHCSDFQP